MKKFLSLAVLLCYTQAFCVIELSVYDRNKVLDLARDFLPDSPNILDAGAFDGTDTVAMAKMWPKGMLYAFEPVPEIYHWLANKTHGYENIRCFGVALSNKVGYHEFFLSEDPQKPGVNFQSGSLLTPKEHLRYSHIQFNKKTIVPTITVDKWAELYNISHIDMMWLDMQGMELEVLKASPNILQTVKVIYTEVEFVEAYAGQGMYQDIKMLLEENGFVEYAKNFKAPGNGGWGWFGDVMFIKRDLIAN